MSPWDSLLELVGRLVSPDWGALIAQIPLALAVLVVGYLGWVTRRLLTAPASRTRPLPAARTPAHIHMPGPSLAPFLAAAGLGCFFLALLFVHAGARTDPLTKQPIQGSTTVTIQPFGLLAIAIGVVALVASLLYWGREASRAYAALEAPAVPPAVVRPEPPAGVRVPGPSFRPLLLAVATSTIVLGGVLSGAVLVGGVLMLLITLLGWLRDARQSIAELADLTGHLENTPAPGLPTRTLLAFGAILAASVLVAAGIFPPGNSAATGTGPAAASQASGGAAAGTPAASLGASAPSPGGPAGSPAASAAPGASVTLQLTASGMAYDKADLAAPAGTPFQIVFTNNDAGIPHNVSIRQGSASGAEVFKGEIFSGTGTRTYTVPALPAGTYAFVCSVHPNMVGTLTVK